MQTSTKTVSLREGVFFCWQKVHTPQEHCCYSGTCPDLGFDFLRWDLLKEGYNLINTMAWGFCVMVSLSHSMPGWEVEEKGFCG